MSYHIYCRILGYVATIALHMGNILLALGAPRTKDVTEDPNLRIFGSLQPRYLTVWTFMLQTTHAIVGLRCDYLTLKNSKTKGYKLPKHLRGFRDILFSAIIWPSVFVVATTFWPMYIYDRNLIFPAFLDKVISPASNHIMHTLIVPLAVWELIFQPRSTPKSHLRHILHIIFHFGLYLSVVIYTYYDMGHWLYPFLGKIYGTIYFYIYIVYILVISFIFYSMQWPITEMIHGSRSINKKQMKKRH